MVKTGQTEPSIAKNSLDDKDSVNGDLYYGTSESGTNKADILHHGGRRQRQLSAVHTHDPICNIRP